MLAHFISSNCANCGGNLEVYDDMEQFACGHCGTEIAVKPRGGTIVLQVMTRDIRKVQIDNNKATAELDLIRLREELQALSKRRDVKLNEGINWKKRGYMIGVALLLVGFFVTRSGGFVIGLGALMAGMFTISFTRRYGKAMRADIRELDVKIDVLDGRIEDREKLTS
jgi:DNA-directed RNA polymerase subunit RPC12/RpoP